MSRRWCCVQAGLFVLSCCFLLLLSGCKVGPNYQPPDYPVPDQWHEKAVQGVRDGSAPLETWWEIFNDPMLEDLIRQAREQNLSLKTAYARVTEARALLGVAAGKYWPGVDAVGSYERSKASERGHLKDVPGLTGDPVNLHTIGLDATWEIDVFGRIARSVESAKASMQASIEDYRDVLVSLYSEVAQTYITLRSLQSRIQYARENIKLQTDMLKLVQERRKVELVPELDVQQARLVLATTQALLPRLQRLETAAIYRLSVLLGQPPASLYETLSVSAGIPKAPETLAAGLPAELLRQRPDVRRAERQLAAQTARIGAATAGLYPVFSLSGTFALEAQQMKGVGDVSDSHTWGFGPAMRWNIFDGNRVRSLVKAQEARAEQILRRYEQTVLLALEDVENAMVAWVREQQRLAALEQSVQAARKSLDLVMDSYDIGLTDFQNVLDMQRSLTTQEDLLAQSRGQVANNVVRLYAALGGGWSLDVPAENDENKPAVVQTADSKQ